MAEFLHCDIAVTGAGIMGLSCALELARAGLRVVVLDNQNPGLKASWAAAGILVTRGATRPLSTFRRFYLQSIASYPTWLAALENETGIAVPFTRGGDHLVFDLGTELGQKSYHAKIAQLDREESRPWQESSELPEFLKPFARAGDFRTLHFDQEAYVQNRILLQALEAACRKRDITFITSHQLAISPSQGHWQIDLGNACVSAAHLLITAGAWSQSGLNALGWSSNLIPVKGQVVRLNKPWPETAMVHVQEDLYLIPRGNHMVVGATTEPGIWDEDFNLHGSDSIKKRLHALLPALPFEPLEAWSGLRPRTRDRLPLMGRVPGQNHAWLCTGHYKCGISMAPLAAQCVAAAIQGHRPPMDIEAFDPARKGALKAMVRSENQ